MGSAASFIEGCRQLQLRVGTGILEGEVIVDQIYAAYQHEITWLDHPRGGGPHYLRNPLLAHAPSYLQFLADRVLDGNLAMTMAANMEHLSEQLKETAPVDEDPNLILLRTSGNPIVRDNGAEVYNRPPVSPRETKAMKKAEDRLKRKGRGKSVGRPKKAKRF